MSMPTGGRFESARARWEGVGPYYAMFPTRFATDVIEAYTDEGDTVLDPFAGRGTSLYSAAANGRHALGVEINPVGWVYASAKLSPAQHSRVAARVQEIGNFAGRFRAAAKAMPLFYRSCYTLDVLAFLLAARQHLDWRESTVDRTAMAIMLVDLHGKRGTALSNQMRQTKCMAPNYALRWWKEQGMRAPRLDPVELLLKKMKWRYARGLPDLLESRVYLGDCTHKIAGLHTLAERLAPRGARLLFTSPPYFSVTNYHYDQWLRLWMLGGPQLPRSLGEPHRGKFENLSHYRALLLQAFTRARELLARDATVYVRSDSRKATARVTRDVLGQVFPRHRVVRRLRPLTGKTQTRLFSKSTVSQAEVDFILQPA